jgi:hypothetical protein
VPRDAFAHDLFHRARLGEAKDAPVKLLRVGMPPRYVEDDCPFCGRHDRVVEADGLCPGCSNAAAA